MIFWSFLVVLYDLEFIQSCSINQEMVWSLSSSSFLCLRAGKIFPFQELDYLENLRYCQTFIRL